MKVTAGLLAVGGLCLPAALSAQRSSTPADHLALVDRYCVTCQSERLETAGLSLEGLDAATVADPGVWSAPNKRGLTPLFIAEGYGRVGVKRSRPTTDMTTQLMLREGLATDGPRPEIRDIYETPQELVEPPNQPLQ